MRTEYFTWISLVGTIALCVTTVPSLLAIVGGQSEVVLVVRNRPWGKLAALDKVALA